MTFVDLIKNVSQRHLTPQVSQVLSFTSQKEVCIHLYEDQSDLITKITKILMIFD